MMKGLICRYCGAKVQWIEGVWTACECDRIAIDGTGAVYEQSAIRSWMIEPNVLLEDFPDARGANRGVVSREKSGEDPKVESDPKSE